ncbi:Beta-defensin 129 [Cricetulus griseus]|uniref:Beta-defensin n=1 Tax=Cricetulus griseus TaxID=10029 RepID=G3HEB1_CRIGR|nr:Beta-defensin 129 [Cricetulus griseus]
MINLDPVLSLSLPHAAFVGMKKCILGFGKCKDSCLAKEIEVQNCKSKKCCIGPKVTELIKSYLRHEIPHIPDKDIVEMLKNEKNFREEMQRKHTLAALFQPQDASPSHGINSAIVPNTSPVKFVTSRTRRHGLDGTVSTKRHMKPIRSSASAAPQPGPGPS